MDKSPEAFRTISEVAEALDVPPHVLRFWETRFTQVKPVKRGGGRRYYRPEDVRLLRGIRGLLYDDGMTIKGVQKILREKGVRHVVGLGTVPDVEAEAGPVAPAAPPPAPAKVAPTHPTAPQSDLFGAATEVLAAPAETVEAAPEIAAEVLPAPADTPAPAKPTESKSLATLVSELEALRAVMIADPER